MTAEATARHAPAPEASAEAKAVDGWQMVPIIIAFAIHFSLCAFFLRQAIDWDGLAFLMRPRAFWFKDLAHVAYPAVLQGTGAVLALFGIPPDTAGKLLSAFCASGVFIALASLLKGLGVRRPGALAAAGLCTTAPAFFTQAVSVEVYAPALLCVLLAGRAAMAYAHRPRAIWLSLAFVLFLTGTAFHVCSIIAALWVASLLRRPGRSVPFRHLLPLLVLLLGCAAACWFAGIGRRDVAAFFADVRGFLWVEPSDSGRFLAGVGGNVSRAARFFADEAPVVALIGLAGFAISLLRDRDLLMRSFWLLAPYLALWFIAGVPILGLLLPVVMAFAIAAGAASAAVRDRPRLRNFWDGLVVAAALLQAALLAPRAWGEMKAPDRLRLESELLASKLPKHAILLAGKHAQHLRFYSQAEVFAVDEIFHQSHAQGFRRADPVHVLGQTLRPLNRQGRKVYITNDGAVRLWEWAKFHHGSGGEAYEGLSARLLASDPPIVVRPDPGGPLWLQRLRALP